MPVSGLKSRHCSAASSPKRHPVKCGADEIAELTLGRVDELAAFVDRQIPDAGGVGFLEGSTRRQASSLAILPSRHAQLSAAFRIVRTPVSGGAALAALFVIVLIMLAMLLFLTGFWFAGGRGLGGLVQPVTQDFRRQLSTHGIAEVGRISASARQRASLALLRSVWRKWRYSSMHARTV